MTYDELVTSIQSYTENQFPAVYLADGTTEGSSTQINRFIQQAEQRIYNMIQFPSIRKNVTGTTTISNKYLSCPDDFLATYSMAVINADGSYEYLLNKDVNFIRQAYPTPTDIATPKYYALFGPSVAASVISNELTFILGPTPDAAYSIELHYYYYPVSIVRGQMTGVGAITGGSGYINGTYYNVPLTGGTGTGAVAAITVASGSVSAVTISTSGCQYLVGDIVSVSSTYIGGSGTGFSVPVTFTTNPNGTSWLGDNFDSVLLYGCLVEAYTFMKGEQDIISLYDTKFKEALALAKRLGDGMERQDAYRSGQYRQAVT